MKGCVVCGITYHAAAIRRRDSGEAISYHEVPSDPDLRKKWFGVIHEHANVTTELTPYSKVCSQHFLPSDFKGTHRRVLRKGIIPTLFNHKQNTEQEQKLSRKKRQPRLTSTTSLKTYQIVHTTPLAEGVSKSKRITIERKRKKVHQASSTAKGDSGAQGAISALNEVEQESAESIPDVYVEVITEDSLSHLNSESCAPQSQPFIPHENSPEEPATECCSVKPGTLGPLLHKVPVVRKSMRPELTPSCHTRTHELSTIVTEVPVVSMAPTPRNAIKCSTSTT